MSIEAHLNPKIEKTKANKSTSPIVIVSAHFTFEFELNLNFPTATT